MYKKDKKEEIFDKNHELGYYSRNNIVDKLTNQKIDQYSIGEGSFINITTIIDKNTHKEELNLEDEQYYFIFKHGEEFLKIEEYREWSHDDLIRVDFKNKNFEIIKNFFK